MAGALDQTSSLKPGARRAFVASQRYLEAAQKVVAVRTDLDLPDPAPLTPITDLPAWNDFAHAWNVGRSAEAVATTLSERRH